MRLEHILISLMALVIGFGLIALGVWLFLNASPFGFTFLILGGTLLLLFSFLSRRRYVLIQMGGAAIQDRVIAHFATKCLQNLFPSQKITCDVVVHRKGKIEIRATLPTIDENEREETFLEIETKLAIMLAENCGIKDPFLFNVSC